MSFSARLLECLALGCSFTSSRAGGSGPTYTVHGRYWYVKPVHQNVLERKNREEEGECPDWCPTVSTLENPLMRGQ